MKRLSHYKEFVSESEISRIYRKGTELSKYHILHINSSYYGGGIAEILRNMVPLLNEIGVEVGWRAMVGSPDFFRVCKRFHNSLLGEGIDLTEMKKKVYEGTNEDFSRFTHVDHDLVIVHNHQPLPLIRFLQKRQPWIWRCHEDLSTPNQEVLDYLKSFIIPFDKCVFQTGKCIFSDFQKECSFVNPTIDPLSTKNEYLDDNKIKKYLNRIGIDLSRPIVSQVSEFDKHKDPIGALEVFKQINEEMDCQFILIGSVSRYDPEGESIYGQVREKVKEMENVSLVLDPHDIFINSVQSASDVVLQKSLKEGFGLAVSEALWKETPVVGSDVGGIAMQIVDGENGYLVDPGDYDEAAEKIMDILSDDDLRERMGRRGKEIIKDRFLITHQIEKWLDIWREML
ncbi:hypothetical protein AKJ66_03420 [candidate division MSBL1 archaeon SCGC-AAA259E22]|uniref:Uncharacterized protein n=1 Tax=candidate division MSBL1 archaeon SCGC-AAA259E22 TaxID=1698265 RepID=A0A133UF92_9EURY|nr:hypothetical protein AKJ66_03420 [candidate division MSBL1 archaeon SCGC-AAA259E22]